MKLFDQPDLHMINRLAGLVQYVSNSFEEL